MLRFKSLRIISYLTACHFTRTSLICGKDYTNVMTECIFTPFGAEEEMISAKETKTHAHAVAMATCLKHTLTFKGADVVEAYL